jgi:hypothetical protein
MLGQDRRVRRPEVKRLEVRRQESGVAGVQNADTLAGTDTGVTSIASLVEIFVARGRLVTVHKSKSRHLILQLLNF